MMWLLLSLAHAATVGEAFPPPLGATRVPTDAFGASLLDLPLREGPIRTHDGRVVPHDGHVIDLPLVPGDLQQCADSILRVRLTWLRDRSEPVLAHATSGDPLPYDRWQREHPRVEGNRVVWGPGPGGDWEAYLAFVFTYAGTASLAERETRPADTPRPGDMLIAPGFPGHAVLLLDVARRGEEWLVLVGEGFMPAQDFHVERGPVAGWWSWSPDGLALPAWTFGPETLRRWR